jgi:NADH dehydrogenase [ubiquinone] 1 alpha subcomplex assembly factor 7
MKHDLPPLETEVRRRIAGAGPMSVAQYMSLCLAHPEHGYYVTRDPFGANADFVTAPEISQMFGELVGLWAALVWQRMGSPENVRLVELGPGRGTMMLDALRAVKIMPAFRSAIVLHLVEISPPLRKRQRQAFADLDMHIEWHPSLAEVPDGPMIILANEFFDALPVHQAVMCVDGWHERVIKLDDHGQLQFGISRDPIPLFDQLLPRSMDNTQIGEIFEWRTDGNGLELGRRVMRSRGAALVIDYGHARSAPGDTLQAVGSHRFTDPLASPGLVDLTAHVDFQALGEAAESMGAQIHGPVEQGDFLRRLGIESRATALQSAASPEKRRAIIGELDRLIEPEGMGRLFKTMAVTHPKLGPLPGFTP